MKKYASWLGHILMAGSVLSPFQSFAASQSFEIEGSAPIAGDPASIRYNAIADARRRAVVKMLKEAIGADAAAAVSEDKLQELTSQLTDDHLLIGTGTPANGAYHVSITVNFDRETFRGTLEDLGIRSSMKSNGSGNSDTIVVMIDVDRGLARDLTKPKEVIHEFDSAKGASYSDKSMRASLKKSQNASTNSKNSGFSEKAASAAQAANRHASAQSAATYRAVGVTSSKSASASSRSLASVQKNNVQAETHDVLHYRDIVINQDTTPKADADAADFALGALQSNVEGMGLKVQSANNFTDFFSAHRPSFKELQGTGRVAKFKSYLASQGVKFFLSATMTISDGAVLGNLGAVQCSGTLTGEVTTTSGVGGLGSGSSNKTATAVDASACQNALVARLGADVGEQIGKRVNNYYRDQKVQNAQISENDRAATEAAYAQAQTGADYTVTFVAPPTLNFALQAQIASAMDGIPGVEKMARISAGPQKIIYKLYYKGKADIENAIGMKLLANPAFAKMQPKVDGTDVLICLSACSK